MAENSHQTMLVIAENVKSACLEAAIEGYQNAAISGLCHEGACEASVSAIKMVDLTQIISACVCGHPDEIVDSATGSE